MQPKELLSGMTEIPSAVCVFNAEITMKNDFFSYSRAVLSEKIIYGSSFFDSFRDSPAQESNIVA